MAERVKIVPEVCILFIKDGKILLLRRQNTGWNDGWYCTPAGHVEEAEAARDGAVREAMEEVGIAVRSEDLELVHTQHRWAGNHSRVGFYFIAKQYEGEPKNLEPEKCDHLDYFSLDALPEKMIAPFKLAIECYSKGITYSEFGWEKKV